VLAAALLFLHLQIACQAWMSVSQGLQCFLKDDFHDLGEL